MGLTKVQLAEAANISSATVTKIEKLAHSPSLSILQAIARVLNLPLSSIIEPDNRDKQCCYVSASDHATVRGRGKQRGHARELLGYTFERDLVIEPFLIRCNHPSEAPPLSRSNGIKLVYMLSGKSDYIHASKAYSLSPGDTLILDASAQHGQADAVALPVHYLTINISKRLADS